MKTTSIILASLMCLLIGYCPIALAETAPEDLVKAGAERLKDNQNSQVTIDELHDDKKTLEEEFHALLKVVDGLKVYNGLLDKQLRGQNEVMAALDGSIANAAVIERQILPLLTRMLDGLQSFVALDLPFLMEERVQRIDALRELIARSDLTNAEKTRRVFEAYQIENEYGSTIETYKGKLHKSNLTFDVDYLRVGRVSYAYRTVGSNDYGYWDGDNSQWVDIKDSNLERGIDKGIKMAKGELAPELLTIPLASTARGQK